MSKTRRYFRCPNCNFEHPTFFACEIRADHAAVIPWSCPICKSAGKILENGAVLGDVSILRPRPTPVGRGSELSGPD